MGLTSFGSELRVAVIGASGGIGGAVADRLAADPAVAEVLRLARGGPIAIDVTDEASVAAAAEACGENIALVFVATGLLQGQGISPERDWRHLDAEAMARSFAVNAIGPALVAKHFLPRLRRDGRAVFTAISARVGSIGDNRLGGWYAYRASKAALNQLIRTLSIELARKRPNALAVALHPGTVDTTLSKPFQRGVAEGKLFTPDYSAGQLLGVIDRLGPEDGGGLFAWDGSRIPW